MFTRRSHAARTDDRRDERQACPRVERRVSSRSAPLLHLRHSAAAEFRLFRRPEGSPYQTSGRIFDVIRSLPRVIFRSYGTAHAGRIEQSRPRAFTKSQRELQNRDVRGQRGEARERMQVHTADVRSVSARSRGHGRPHATRLEHRGAFLRGVYGVCPLDAGISKKGAITFYVAHEY